MAYVDATFPNYLTRANRQYQKSKQEGIGKMLDREQLDTASIPKDYSVGEAFRLDGFCGLLELVKAEEAKKKGADDKYAYVAGIFSADTKDLDGEVLDQDGVSEGLRKYFAKLNCQVDWEHEYGNTKDPDALIGECLRFEPRIIKKSGKRHRAHWGEFRLFKKKKLAKKVLDHLDAGGKIGASVHGLKLATDGGRVNKVMITRISLTPNPVNTETSIKRYDKFMKSLTATAGAAITPEDLEGDAKKKLYGRVKGLARNFMEQGLSGQETKKALVSYFDEQLTKGELTMDDLKKAAVELAKSLEAEAPKTVEASTEEEKEAKTLLEKTFAKFGYKLVKANAKGDEADEDEDEEEEGETFSKAATYLKSLDRTSLLKMCKAAKIADEVKGKKDGDMAEYLTKHLGNAGTVALVKQYRKACKSTVDTELAAEDEKLLKSLEAEEASIGGDADLDAEIGEEIMGVVSDESYKQLIKAVGSLRKTVETDRTRYDEPMLGLTKAVQVLLSKQKDDRVAFEALCKAIRLPAFNRMSLVSSTAKVADAQPPQGAGEGTVRPQAEIEGALRKAVEEGKGNVLSAREVAVARNRGRRGAPLPKEIDKKLFPAATAAA